MRSNTAYSEERYTYTEFKLMEQRRRQKNMQMIIQKFLGVVCLLLVVLEFVASRKDWIDEGGLFLVALPLGLLLLFANKKIIMI